MRGSLFKQEGPLNSYIFSPPYCTKIVKLGTKKRKLKIIQTDIQSTSGATNRNWSQLNILRISIGEYLTESKRRV